MTIQNNSNYNPPSPSSSVFKITNIERGRFTKLTVGLFCGNENSYTIGQRVLCNIPPECGIAQLSGKVGTVVYRTSANQFSIDIDSSTFDSFIPAPFYSSSPPTIVLAWQ